MVMCVVYLCDKELEYNYYNLKIKVWEGYSGKDTKR